MFLRQLVKSSTLLMRHCEFRCYRAIVRELPDSFAQHAVKSDVSQLISLSRARQQWQNYKDTLKLCGLKVITLPTDEKNPDCTFVEDTAVVIGQKACLTRPGHHSRMTEVEIMRDCLQSLDLEIHELNDPEATLDGGDVLFTGQEIFVGNSLRTNKAGIDSLQRVFSNIPVIDIPIVKSLHLKSVATLAQEGVILVGGAGDAQTVLKILSEEARGQYRVVQLEKEESANVVFLNGNVIIKTERELGSDFQKLISNLTVPWIAIEFDELYKADGCLSCCCICVQDIC